MIAGTWVCRAAGGMARAGLARTHTEQHYHLCGPKHTLCEPVPYLPRSAGGSLRVCAARDTPGAPPAPGLFIIITL